MAQGALERVSVGAGAGGRGCLGGRQQIQLRSRWWHSLALARATDQMVLSQQLERVVASSGLRCFSRLHSSAVRVPSCRRDRFKQFAAYLAVQTVGAVDGRGSIEREQGKTSWGRSVGEDRFVTISGAWAHTVGELGRGRRLVSRRMACCIRSNANAYNAGSGGICVFGVFPVDLESLHESYEHGLDAI